MDIEKLKEIIIETNLENENFLLFLELKNSEVKVWRIAHKKFAAIQSLRQHAEIWLNISKSTEDYFYIEFYQLTI